jgi:glycosyltransferase involved in cell wall biosynthesis
MSIPSPPRISCIVPVYNGEKYLAEALESIFRQTLAAFEVIVVDDGSTDSTPSVAGRDARVKYLRQANAGPSAARNHGIRESSGELLAFLDADDLWHPEKLERQATRFAACPGLDISLTHARNFWAPEVRDEEERFGGARVGVLPAQSMMVRRSLFDRVGLFDVSMLHREVPGWLVHAKHAGAVIETLAEVLCDRRIHETNRSRGAREAPSMMALAQAMLEKRRARSTTAT